MTVGVVIPCWNEPAERMRQTIASAIAVSPLIVLVDDGSRVPVPVDLFDDVLVVRLDANVGPAAAMNAGAARAIAEGATRIARLDVGDAYRAEAKLRQLELDAVAVFSRHHDLVEGVDRAPPRAWPNVIYRDGVFCIDTMVIDADAWTAVGGFDPALRYGDDWDFTIRVQHAIGWTFFDEVTCEAGAFPGGHTMTAYVDPVKRARRDADTARIRERANMLREPARHRHLFDPAWRAKRGLEPL